MINDAWREQRRIKLQAAIGAATWSDEWVLVEDWIDYPKRVDPNRVWLVVLACKSRWSLRIASDGDRFVITNDDVGRWGMGDLWPSNYPMFDTLDGALAYYELTAGG